MKTAWKKAIDECPDGNDLDASRTKKFLSIMLVHVYSVMYSLQARKELISLLSIMNLKSKIAYPPEQLMAASGLQVSRKCGLSSPTNTYVNEIIYIT